MRRVILIALSIGLALQVPAGTAAPARGGGAARDVVGIQPARGYQICTGPIPHAPEAGLLCTATSDSGYTIEMNGTGRYDTTFPSSGGGGAWLIRDASGLPVEGGVWVNLVPISFESWGTTVDLATPLGPVHLDVYPLEGGVARIAVFLFSSAALPGLNGHLAYVTIRCRIGPGTPPDAIEGIEVDVPGFANFNHTQLGATLFERLLVS